MNHKLTPLLIILLIFVIHLTIPVWAALAADGSYYLPCIEETKSLFGPSDNPANNPCGPGGDFRDYIQRFFGFAYATAGIIGVGMIAWGGLQYALSDSVTSKKDGQAVIQRTLWGIALLMSSYFILKTINPAIIDFNKIPGGFVGEEAKIVQENDLPSTACLGGPNDQPGKNCRPICSSADEQSKMCSLDSKTAKKQLEDGGPTACVLCAPDPENPSFCPKAAFQCNLSNGPGQGTRHWNSFGRGPAGSYTEMTTTTEGVTSITLTRDEDVEIPECESGQDWMGYTSCEDGIADSNTVTIKKGGKLWFYPYYPRDKGMTAAECYIYAYRVDADSYTHMSDLYGLIKC